jgi:uncharacterized membrane protein
LCGIKSIGDVVSKGIAFLVLFIATYFYGIQVTMLTKSITLAATGTVILLARWLFVKMFSTPLLEDSAHA